MDALSIILKSKENCSMKQSLDWLENHFKSSVQEQYQTGNEIFGKIILLVDAKAHEIQWA